MLSDILHHAGSDGPQLIRGDDGAEHLVVTRTSFEALLARVGERAPAPLPHRAATEAEINAHLEEFCGVPRDLDLYGLQS